MVPQATSCCTYVCPFSETGCRGCRALSILTKPLARLQVFGHSHLPLWIDPVAAELPRRGHKTTAKVEAGEEEEDE